MSADIQKAMFELRHLCSIMYTQIQLPKGEEVKAKGNDPASSLDSTKDHIEFLPEKIPRHALMKGKRRSA